MEEREIHVVKQVVGMVGDGMSFDVFAKSGASLGGEV